MPSRQSVRLIESEEVQGDDSWVRIKYPTVEFMREALAQTGLSVGASTEGKTIQQFEFGVRLIQKHVLDWNWVDDNGDPLPKPAADPNVVDALTSMELRWLAEQLNPSPANPGEKNSDAS